MNEKQLILRFSGKKVDLHKQLKRWCLEADKTMNGTVVELVEKHLNKNKLATNLKDWRKTQ